MIDETMVGTKWWLQSGHFVKIISLDYEWVEVQRVNELGDPWSVRLDWFIETAEPHTSA